MILDDLIFNNSKSTEYIKLKCDYCGVEFSKRKHNVIYLRKNNKKDSCGSKQCTINKRNESTKSIHGEDCFKNKFLEKSKKTNLKKYGVTNASKSNKIKKKIAKTNLKRYGKTSFLATDECEEQRKKIALEKYNVDHFSKAKEIKEKTKNTCCEKYGCNFQSTKDWKEKVKKTCIEKYGKESPMQVNKFKNKLKKTLIEKYGVDTPLRKKEFILKSKETLLKNHGVDSALKSNKLLDKFKKTCIERYGKEHAMQNNEIKQKAIKNKIEKYGSANPKFGKTQESIRTWLNSYNLNFESNYEILEGKELDLYDENKKLAIEYCGLYWHNENSPEPRTRKYHYNKYKKCKDKGVQLLTIFDDEWNNKQNIIKSVILSKLGIFDKRIYGRKCETKKIDKKTFCDFCDIYHVQGKNSLSLVCFGLFYKDDLVGVVDLGRHHRKNDKDSLVLTRLCFKQGYQIVGGSSKLFSAVITYCRDNNIKNIVSWSDNRWSDGKIYKNLGFQLIEELKPDYCYVDIKNPKKRISKQSQKKSNSNCPKDTTEYDWATSRGLSRIWDCGKTRWNYKIL